MRFRAYLFDVQGTLLDFFTPVRAAIQGYLDDHSVTGVDPSEFTRAWRSDYFQRVTGLTQSVGAWHRVQDEYTAGFRELCRRRGIPEPGSAAAAVASAWQRLQPWPDVPDGLARLRATAITATLSNTDMSTMVTMVKDLRIGMDAIFTAELFGAFKPDPVVYRRALQYLGVRPHEAAMVACHPYDLEAAGELGLATVFVRRPHEYGDPALAHDVPPDTVSQYVHAIGEIE